MTTTDLEKAGSGDAAADDAAATGDAPGGELVPAGSGGSGGGGLARTALLEPDESPRAEALRSRLLVPLLVPIIAAAAIAFYAINVSRALLAGGSTGALVIASLLTLAILAGIVWISATPKLRTSTLAVVLGGLVVLVGAIGLTSLGPSEDQHSGEASGGFVEPAGDPVATVTVDALATLKFQADNFDTAAGINEFVYVLGGGVHTLVFEEPEFRGFKLEVSAAKPEDRGKVELEAGTYTIYCDIPGHRAAGMEATVTVT